MSSINFWAKTCQVPPKRLCRILLPGTGLDRSTTGQYSMCRVLISGFAFFEIFDILITRMPFKFFLFK